MKSREWTTCRIKRTTLNELRVITNRRDNDDQRIQGIIKEANAMKLRLPKTKTR